MVYKINVDYVPVSLVPYHSYCFFHPPVVIGLFTLFHSRQYFTILSNHKEKKIISIKLQFMVYYSLTLINTIKCEEMKVLMYTCVKILTLTTPPPPPQKKKLHVVPEGGGGTYIIGGGHLYYWQYPIFQNLISIL